ncbi:MAG: serine/threonine-protein kinase [Verrucomicrobia bacterium]|nr:serine/threonine-protein kinase [Verrucomicrobiota bacterium]
MTGPGSQEELLFDAARKLTDPAQRKAFLDAACANHPQMRQRIEDLLAAQSDAEKIFEQARRRATPTAAVPNPSHASESSDTPTVVSPATDEGVRAPIEGPGTVIGHYKLLEKIGEGGCGVVYMAEQEQPVRRRVALKVIKLGMDTREVIARFEAEQQALALMDHPNIAQVFDAGATDTGRPYFVMELVRGVPITQFCDEQRVAVRERLELFMTVCQAVHHAHQKGIIHRDIKPSNVLVTLHDGVAVPKVIDFGIAKATQQKLTDKTLFTQFHQFLGTPAYMSPEQAELSGLDIDTRSDIYSLGVLLYELLAGKTPFDAKELLAVGLDEMRRTIREKEPVKPSTRLTMELGTHGVPASAGPARDVPERSGVADARPSKAGTPNSPADSRRLRQIKELIGLVRGDLDWIVMKALEKDRRRRYESASGFGQDVERYLKQEPVSAAAPSAVYKFRKFARRNRMTLTAVATIAFVLIAGAVVSTWQAVRATLAEEKAQTEAAISKAVNDFLQNDLLTQASPESQPDRDVTLRTVLDRASATIEGRFEKQPLVEASIRSTLDRTYSALGEVRIAEAHARRAFELYRLRLGAEHPATLTSMNNLAVAYQAQGKLTEAATLHAQVLDIVKRVLGSEHPNTLLSMNNLAAAYQDQGKLTEAATLKAQVLDIQKRVLGPEHPDTLGSMNNLASVYNAQGKSAEAATLHSQDLEIQKRALGPEHPHTLWSMNNLAGAYGSQGKHAEAATLHAQVLEIRKRVLGPEHPDTLGSMNNLADLYHRQGKLSEAERLLKETLQLYRGQMPPEVQGFSGVLANLGHVLLTLQKFAEAEALLRECLELRQKSMPGDWRTFHTRSMLGAALSGQQRFAAAEPLLLEGYEGLKEREQRLPASNRVKIREAGERLVQLYEAWGKPAEAAEWKAKLKPDSPP